MKTRGSWGNQGDERDWGRRREKGREMEGCHRWEWTLEEGGKGGKGEMGRKRLLGDGDSGSVISFPGPERGVALFCLLGWLDHPASYPHQQQPLRGRTPPCLGQPQPATHQTHEDPSNKTQMAGAPEGALGVSISHLNSPNCSGVWRKLGPLRQSGNFLLLESFLPTAGSVK